MHSCGYDYPGGITIGEKFECFGFFLFFGVLSVIAMILANICGNILSFSNFYIFCIILLLCISSLIVLILNEDIFFIKTRQLISDHGFILISILSLLLFLLFFGRLTVIALILTIICGNIFSFFHFYIFCIILLLCISSLIVLILNEDTCFIKTRQLISDRGFILVSILSLFLFLFLYILYISQPLQIILDPIQLETKIPAGEISVKSLSIKYMGDGNISLNCPKSDYWNFTCKDHEKLEYNEMKVLRFKLIINVHSNATPGEYRSEINLIQNTKIIKDIPILITILPKAQYHVDINEISKVNLSDWFKLRVTITNTGESPVYGVNIIINKSESNSSSFNFSEAGQNMTSDLLVKNAQFVTDWWIGTNNSINTSWEPVQFNITSANAGNQTVVTMIKIEKKSSTSE